MRIAFFLLPLVMFGLLAHAEDEVLAEFSLTSPSAAVIRELSQHFDLEHWQGNSARLIVPESQISNLLSIAPSARLVEPDTAAAAQARLFLFSIRPLSAGKSYHSFDQVQKWMQDLAAAQPDLASVVTYGTSGAGRPLLALRLNKGAVAKPVLLITAATHGDELITTEILLTLVEQLIQGQGTDARLTSLLEKHDLYFVPVLNPDGFTATRRYDGASDPNRSYPWPGHDNAVPTPSIAGIIQLFNTIRPAGTLDLHAYGGMVMYPWAYTYSPIDPAFAVPFGKLATDMAATNHYAHGPISDVIYIARGSSADYYFWKTNSVSLAIEVGSEKIPDPSEIPAYAQEQAESLWRFIESF